MELINEALNIVKKSRAFDINYKYSRKYQFHRQLTLLALKAKIPEDALRYAKLCNRPDFIADTYFENSQFEKCLLYYMALIKPYTIYPGWTWSPSEKLSRNRLPKVAKAFYYLSEKYPKRYNLENFRGKFGWLYNQVISRFGSLEDAFSYYKLYAKPSPKKKERKKSLKKVEGKADKIQFQEILELHQSFKKKYFDKINHLSVLLNQGSFKSAKAEMIRLYEKYKALEAETGSKVIGIGKIVNLPVENADLVTDIAEIFLLNQEFEEALSWIYEHIDEHWRYVDYFLNLKFLLNKDIQGEDVVRIGFSARFRNNVGSFVCKKFYTPSMFAKRNIEEIEKRCDAQLSDHTKRFSISYLNYLVAKYPKGFPHDSYGLDDTSYRYVYEMFGGKYGKYGLDEEITIQDLIEKENINPVAFHGSEKHWTHIEFTDCHEMVQLISNLCTNSENQLRRERGIPEIGEQWKSETEIYALIKEIFSDYEVSRHSSPIWLSPMHLDVYVPELSLAVEYQGQQHYKPVEIFGGREGFEKTELRDTIKVKLCQQNEVNLLCIRYDDEEPEKTIADFVRKKLKLRIGL